VGSAAVRPLANLSLPISIVSIWALARINLFFIYFAYAGHFFLTRGRSLSNVQALYLLTISNACARVLCASAVHHDAGAPRVACGKHPGIACHAEAR
jgi:hypothetical protein